MRIDLYTKERIPDDVARRATAAALSYDEDKIAVLKRSNYTKPGVYVIPWDVDFVEGFSCEYTIADPTNVSNYWETWSKNGPRDVTQLVFARVWSKIAGVDVLAQVFVGADEDEWFVVHPDGTETPFEMPEEE